MLRDLLAIFLLLGLNDCKYRWRVNPRKPNPLLRSELPNGHQLNQPGQCYCGIPNTREEPKPYSNRIVGGENTLLGEYPWQVSLLYQGVIKNHMCGGSLVSSRHVVTAAHCTQNLTPDLLGVAVGYTNLSISEQENRSIINVVEIRDHPKYKGPENHYEYDISVLVLEQDIDLTKYPNIKPVCLPQVRSGQQTTKGWYADDMAIVSGWGLTDFFNGTYPQHLKDVMVKVLPKGECGQLSYYIRDSQICAGHQDGGKDACSGDSGGPLVTRDPDNNSGMTLVGVVSAGSTCADKEFPGLYANVKQISSTGWLDQQIEGAKMCSPPPKQTNPSVTTTTPKTTTTTTTPPRTTVKTTTEDRPMAVLLTGGDGYAYGRKVELWVPDSSSPCKMKLPDLPDYRNHHASAMYKGSPLICGGDRTLTTCLAMDGQYNWNSFGIKTKKYRTSHLMVDIQGGGVAIMGGQWSRDTELIVNETSYLLDTGDVPIPRLENSCEVITDDGSMIITGGKGGEDNRKQVWLFNGTWTRLTDMPDSGRYEHSCAFVNQGGKRGVIVAGGSNGYQLLTSSLFFNIDLNIWKTGPTLNHKRWGASLVNLSGRLFLLGGGDGRNYMTTVEELDVVKWTWRIEDSSLIYPRSDFSSLLVPRELFNCQEDDISDVIDPRKA